MSKNQEESRLSQRVSELQTAAAEFLRGKPPWVLGINKALQRFLFIAIPTVIWSVLLLFEGILPEALRFGFTIAIVVVLFLLSIPLSIIHRLDVILADVSSYTNNSKSAAMLVALLYVMINFIIIGAIGGWLKGRKSRR
jgi:hypothetical protein